MEKLVTLAVFATSYAINLDAEVIVVGAGYSGLGAARELNRQGVRVLVLEARDRVGGRTQIKTFEGQPLDFGGAWIEGGSDNPLYALQQEYGFSPEPCSSHHPIDGANQYDFDFVRYTGNGYQNTVLQEYNQATTQADRTVGRSLYDAVALGNGWSGRDQYRYNSTCTHIIELDYAGTSAEMDSRTMMQYNCGFRWSCQAYWPEGGFGGMAQEIAATELEGQIEFNRVVKSISQENGSVSLETEDGVVFTAERAIITLPLGVLKARDVTFSPPLSEAKNTAINRLGLGVCNKVFMSFDRANFNAAPWAQDKMEYFAVEAQRDNQPSWFMNIDEHPIYGGVPVIGSWFCGPDALELELDYDLSLAVHMEKLRGFYPELAEPLNVNVSGWYSDPFARGSYSFPGVGSPINDYDTMATPEGLLHFAGEHTTRAWGSVNGAFESGQAAAQEILFGFDATETSRPMYTEKSQMGLGKPTSACMN